MGKKKKKQTHNDFLAELVAAVITSGQQDDGDEMIRPNGFATNAQRCGNCKAITVDLLFQVENGACGVMLAYDDAERLYLELGKTLSNPPKEPTDDDPGFVEGTWIPTLGTFHAERD